MIAFIVYTVLNLFDSAGLFEYCYRLQLKDTANKKSSLLFSRHHASWTRLSKHNTRHAFGRSNLSIMAKFIM